MEMVNVGIVNGAFIADIVGYTLKRFVRDMGFDTANINDFALRISGVKKCGVVKYCAVFYNPKTHLCISKPSTLEKIIEDIETGCIEWEE